MVNQFLTTHLEISKYFFFIFVYILHKHQFKLIIKEAINENTLLTLNVNNSNSTKKPSNKIRIDKTIISSLICQKLQKVKRQKSNHQCVLR